MHHTSVSPSPSPAPRDVPGGRAGRKYRVLTHGTPSVTPAITDAVVLKDRDLFLVTEPDGNVPRGGKHGLGLYYHDCRYVSTYELTLDGAPPVALGATARAGHRGSIQLTNPELPRPRGADIPRDTIGIEWAREIDGRRLRLADTITVHNWGHAPVDCSLEVWLAAGFEDVFQVRGLLDERLGRAETPAWDDHVLRFRYHGKDGITRGVRVVFPSELTPMTKATGASASIRLAPREQRQLTIEIQIEESGRPKPARAGDAGDADGATTRSVGLSTTVTSDSPTLNEILERCFADLHLLRSTLRGRTFIAAGIPWFATLFGRDSLVAALQLLPYDPAIAADTLRLLASYQGERVDPWRDEAPGKILHELRIGEMANTGEIPHTPYYGTVDATPLFLIVLAQYVAWTGDLALAEELDGHVRRALEWIDRYGDGDGDGYVEYQSASEHGLINQGWKDSGDAIVDEQGRIAQPPIALVEVQAYVYAAKRSIADLWERRGDVGGATRLRHEADALRTRFNRDFWVESLGFYAMALEAGKRPLRVVSSNPGHALWCGIADAAKASRVGERLMTEDMFSGWGVRTLSSAARGYAPIGYHLGTVWPHDNAFVAAGLKRYGLAAEARRIFDGLTEATTDFTHERLPELFSGFAQARYGAPIRYPVACHPQAWAAGALPFLLTQLLGLTPSALERRLRIVRPTLPGFVDALELKGLGVGAAAVDLRFTRGETKVANDGVHVQVLEVRGELDVRVERDTDIA